MNDVDAHVARNMEPYPSSHRENFIKSRLRMWESLGVITGGWSVGHNEDETDWDISFTLTHESERRHMGDREFRALDLGRMMGSFEHHHATEESDSAPLMVTDDVEESAVGTAMVLGHSVNVHLGEPYPMVQIGTDVVRLHTAEGFIEVDDEASARLHDLLVIRHRAIHRAEHLHRHEHEDGCDSSLSEENHDRLNELVNKGWISEWEDQPGNGPGLVVIFGVGRFPRTVSYSDLDGWLAGFESARENTEE